jgi:hypothetical protein
MPKKFQRVQAEGFASNDTNIGASIDISSEEGWYEFEAWAWATGEGDEVTIATTMIPEAERKYAHLLAETLVAIENAHAGFRSSFILRLAACCDDGIDRAAVLRILKAALKARSIP